MSKAEKRRQSKVRDEMTIHVATQIRLLKMKWEDLSNEEKKCVQDLKTIPPHRYKDIVSKARGITSEYQTNKFEIALDQLMLRAYQHFNSELLQDKRSKKED